MNTNAQHYDEHDELYAVIAERDTLRATVRELVAALDKIVRADASGNNGAVVGEAKICPYFEVMATEALANARKVMGDTPSAGLPGDPA